MKSGAGNTELASSNDITHLSEIAIDRSDLDLIGKSWNDRESDGRPASKTYTLLDVKWVLVDSSDGERLPTLVGLYAASADVPPQDRDWSSMGEVRSWISASSVTGPLSDRECRALRRTALTSVVTEQKSDDEDSVIINHLRDGYAFVDIDERAVMPDGGIVYRVVYEVGAKRLIRVWERANTISASAIEKWKQRRSSFKYTADELEVQKNCAASLKEGQAKDVVATSAGIFVNILNCGIIISITMLHGSESLSQVYAHLTDLYERHGGVLPADYAYDAGCQLRRFSELRKDKTPQALSFWERIGRYIFVDRFHWRNHKDSHKYCRDHCNPNNNTRLEGANTEICEQSFRWFARHKYSINNMTPARFRFFLTIIAGRRNEMLMSQRGTLCSGI